MFATMSFSIYFCVFLLAVVRCQQEDACANICKSTYPLHTTDKVAEHKACLTGCRISFITHLSSSSEKNVDVTPICSKDCDHGYTHSTLQVACHLGCESQRVERAVERPHVVEFGSPFELAWHRQLLHPFHHIGRYCNNIYQHATSFVISSVVMQDHAGNTIVMQVDLTPRHELLVNQNDEEPKKPEEGRGLKRFARLAYHHGSKWLNCVEARAGMPYWSLVGVLFLSLFFMCWVCCSSCDEEIANRTKKHMFKEVEAVQAQQLPDDEAMMDKPPPYLIIDYQQAGPLPEKVKLLD